MNDSRSSKRGPVEFSARNCPQGLFASGAYQCDCIAENASIKKPDGDVTSAHSLIDFDFLAGGFSEHFQVRLSQPQVLITNSQLRTVN